MCCPKALLTFNLSADGQVEGDRRRWQTEIGVGVGIGIGVERMSMACGPEKADVDRASIEYVGGAYRFCEELKGHRNAKDQRLRASQAIPLNMAEGNGKGTDGDRRRYFEIARGSALECGAVRDVLQVCGAMSAEDNQKAKALLDRIVAMLTKLGQRGYAVHEESSEYRTDGIDPDTDTDPDGRTEQGRRQPCGPPDARISRRRPPAFASQ